MRPTASRARRVIRSRCIIPLRPVTRRAAVADRRHAHRLRDARRRSAHARATRLRAQRNQPRPEHGRGRAVLGHRRRRDGRLALGIPSIAFSFAGGELQGGPRAAQRQIRGARAARASHVARVPRERCSTSTCRRSGVRHAACGSHDWAAASTPIRSGHADPWDREIYWIGGGSASGAERTTPTSAPSGWLHLGHATAPRPHALRDARPAETWWPDCRAARSRRRRRLVELLQERGIRDLSVLRAFDVTPRHMFVPTGVRHRAYEDSALPIGSGQTISQPCIHAR